MMWTLIGSMSAALAVPFLIIHSLDGVPYTVRLRAMIGMIVPILKRLLVLPVSLSAPFVMPFVLIFTPWDANELPWWARWYDNDVSLNGDMPWYWEQSYGGWTYYAKAHPRSFWARYVWLGWRNRASRLAMILGHRYREGEYENHESWGDPLTGRDHEGHVLNRRGSCWQIYLVKRIGRFCIRINCGYKIWSNAGDGRAVAMPVFVPFSILTWEGPR